MVGGVNHTGTSTHTGEGRVWAMEEARPKQLVGQQHQAPCPEGQADVAHLELSWKDGPFGRWGRQQESRG